MNSNFACASQPFWSSPSLKAWKLAASLPQWRRMPSGMGQSGRRHGVCPTRGLTRRTGPCTQSAWTWKRAPSLKGGGRRLRRSLATTRRSPRRLPPRPPRAKWRGQRLRRWTPRRPRRRSQRSEFPSCTRQKGSDWLAGLSCCKVFWMQFVKVIGSWNMANECSAVWLDFNFAPGLKLLEILSAQTWTIEGTLAVLPSEINIDRMLHSFFN